MSYQAGIKKVTLYENKSFSFVYYDESDRSKITDLTTTGDTIEIENKSLPEMNTKHSLGKQGLMLFDYSIKFYLLDYSIANIQTLQKLKRSIYGWKFLIEYYDGTQRFYNTPVFCRNSSIDPQREFSNETELNSQVPSKQAYLSYTPNATVEVYRADTTLITADSIDISADYSL